MATRTRKTSDRKPRRGGNRQGISETLIKSIVRQVGRRIGTILIRMLTRFGR